MLYNPLDPSYHRKATYRLSEVPPDLKPRSIHIDSDSIDKLIKIASGDSILKSANEVHLTVFIDSVTKRKQLCKILKIENLKFLKIKCRIHEASFIVQFSINNEIDLLNLQSFHDRFINKHLNQTEFIKILPIANRFLEVSWINHTLNIQPLENLKSLTICYSNVGQLMTLPESLEKLKFIETKFKVTCKYTWSSNIREIEMRQCAIDDTTLSNLSNWPNSLRSLNLENNKFYNFRNLGLLPGNLDKLRVFGNNRLKISNIIDSDFKCNVFSESLLKVELSYIEFSHSSDHIMEVVHSQNHIVEFPHNLEELILKSCNITSLYDFKFPSSLTRLGLISNNIDDLNSYNDVAFNKHWNQLENLKYLDLEGNPLLLSVLRNWTTPPKNLKQLTNHISNSNS